VVTVKRLALIGLVVLGLFGFAFSEEDMFYIG